MNTGQIIKNILLSLCVLLLTACSKHFDPTSGEELKELSGKGSLNIAKEVNFSVSCSIEAQSQFDQGLALMHHMMYVQAEKEFALITAKEPNCAMAQWGIAMTLFHPLWPGVTGTAALNKGAVAVEKANSLRPPTAREQAYVDAVAAFYRNWGL